MDTQVDQKVTWQDFEVAPEKRPWERHECLPMEEIEKIMLPPPYREVVPFDWIEELKMDFDVTKYAEFLRDWREASQGVFESIHIPSIGYDVASGESFTVIRDIHGYPPCTAFRNQITGWTP